jgi:hypothetical protein
MGGNYALNVGETPVFSRAGLAPAVKFPKNLRP